MGNDFQSLDILLFAMIAVFLAIRLRNALGRRDQNDGGKKNSVNFKQTKGEENQNIILMPGQEKKKPKDTSINDRDHDEEAENKSASEIEFQGKINKIEELDASFNVEDFIVGSRVAFEMVIKAFVSGDLETLENLLNNEVYSNFHKSINDRELAGFVITDTLVGIVAADILEIYFEDKVVNLTVKFVTNQIKVTHNKDGELIDGDPKSIIEVIDLWTFSRDSQLKNPNWTLIATRSLD
jgi:predicted lipid-binding transport protein (Tim44 family)